MWYCHRTFQYESDDFNKLCYLVSHLNSRHMCDWSIGRLFSWKYGRWSKESQNSAIFCKQAELFFNYWGQLCGIVITENFGESYYLLSESNDFVIQEMVDFLVKGGNFNRPYLINVGMDDTCQRDVLEKNGYTYCGDADTTFVYSVENICLPNIPMPQGFSLTSQREFSDAHQAELLRFYAFNPNGHYDDTLDFAYKFARNNPLLDAELDILLLNEKGEAISTCMGYLDRENRIMEVEVVATKKEYENMGCAKMVISECIKRGISKGVKEICISAWEEKTKKIYASFGICEAKEKINYEYSH